MIARKHTFQGELVLFDDVSVIFSYEHGEASSFLNIEKERLQKEFDSLFGGDQPSDVVFDLSGNRLRIVVSTDSDIHRKEIVRHISLLAAALIRIWEWVLVNYDAPDSSTLMQIKNINYVER